MEKEMEFFKKLLKKEKIQMFFKNNNVSFLSLSLFCSLLFSSSPLSSLLSSLVFSSSSLLYSLLSSLFSSLSSLLFSVAFLQKKTKNSLFVCVFDFLLFPSVFVFDGSKNCWYCGRRLKSTLVGLLILCRVGMQGTRFVVLSSSLGWC